MRELFRMECPFCSGSGNLAEKTIRNTCGISKNFALTLVELGYNKAYVLLGQFLLFRKEEEFFMDWLMEKGDISEEDALHCCSCIRDWCRINLM